MLTLTFSVIATSTFGQVTKISGFSGIGGINNYTPGWLGDVLERTPIASTTLRSASAIGVYILIRYIVRDAVRSVAPGRA